MLLTMFPLLARSGDGGPRILVPLLLIGLIGGLTVWFVRRRRGPGGGAGSAIETLRESFARGDIDRAEFEHRRAVLRGDDVVPPAPARAATATATAPPPPPRTASPTAEGGATADAEAGDAPDATDE